MIEIDLNNECICSVDDNYSRDVAFSFQVTAQLIALQFAPRTPFRA